MNSILLVDDDPDLIELYTELLEQMGHIVVSAQDGQAGLALARELQFDLIITDVSMPRMNGLELCRQLRMDERLRSVPLLIHSSDVNLLIPKGEAFLPKPCELRAFTSLVNRLISSPRWPGSGLPGMSAPPDRLKSSAGTRASDAVC